MKGRISKYAFMQRPCWCMCASAAGGNLDTVIVRLYANLEDVAAAVEDGEVDMVFGLDTIDPKFFR